MQTPCGEPAWALVMEYIDGDTFDLVLKKPSDLNVCSRKDHQASTFPTYIGEIVSTIRLQFSLRMLMVFQVQKSVGRFGRNS